MLIIDRVLNIIDRFSKHSLLRRRALRSIRSLAANHAESVSILFVCKGNICRSAYAAAQLKQRLKKEGLDGRAAVFSAGLRTRDGLPANSSAVIEAAARDLNLQEHKTTRLTNELLQQADIVMLMDASNYIDVRKRLPHGMKNILFLGALSSGAHPFIITDPFGRDNAAFCSCFDQIDSALDSIIAELKGARVAS